MPNFCFSERAGCASVAIRSHWRRIAALIVTPQPNKAKIDFPTWIPLPTAPP